MCCCRSGWPRRCWSRPCADERAVYADLRRGSGRRPATPSRAAAGAAQAHPAGRVQPGGRRTDARQDRLAGPGRAGPGDRGDSAKTTLAAGAGCAATAGAARRCWCSPRSGTPWTRWSPRCGAAGIPAAVYHGSLSRREKDAAVAAFAGDAPVLLSTESAGEGRNLQFCHVMINVDLPWNPMQIEQRLGRLHRVGQQHDVLLTNLVARGTIEQQILHVLETKINLFELVVGELDMILGRVDDDFDFESSVFNAYVTADDDAAFTASLHDIGAELVRPHRLPAHPQPPWTSWSETSSSDPPAWTRARLLAELPRPPRRALGAIRRHRPGAPARSAERAARPAGNRVDHRRPRRRPRRRCAFPRLRPPRDRQGCRDDHRHGGRRRAHPAAPREADIHGGPPGQDQGPGPGRSRPDRCHRLDPPIQPVVVAARGAGQPHRLGRRAVHRGRRMPPRRSVARRLGA